MGIEPPAPPPVRDHRKTDMDIIKHYLEHGTKYPYDFDGDCQLTPPPSTDWAQAAARGVLANLLDRRGIKWGLGDEKIDHETRSEIVQSLAAVIRLAHTEGHHEQD